MSNPTIGFIGLGIMGKPMARNLLKAGYPLVVHNRSRGAVDELSKEGAQAAGNSNDVAARSEIVITMLPDSRASRIRSGDICLSRSRPGTRAPPASWQDAQYFV